MPLQAMQAAAGSNSITPVDEAAQQLLLSREQVKRLQAELMLPLQQVRLPGQLPVLPCSHPLLTGGWVLVVAWLLIL